METPQASFPSEPNPISQSRPVCLFWGATIVLALASALFFLCVALSERTLGGATKGYCVVAAIYAAAIGACLWRTAWRGRLQQVTSKILFLVISTIFSLLVLELAVRVISPPSPFHPALPLRPWYRAGMEIQLPGVSPSGIFSTNAWGFRGDEPPRAWSDYYTFVTIGGSTTQCFFLDDKQAWPYLVQEKLKKNHPKVWVGNGGLDGHSTRGHLIFMREVIPKIKPDAVILLVGCNDFCLSLNEKARVHGNGYDLDSNLSATRASDPVRLMFRFIRRHCRVLELALIWKRVLRKETIRVDRHGQGGNDTVPLREPPPPLPADLSQVLPQLDEFRANLRQIVDIGRSNNVRMIFLTQPLRFEDSEDYRWQLPSYYWLNIGDVRSAGSPRWSAAQHWLLLQEYNRNLLEFCQAENIECFDLAGVVPHGERCFYDLVHFNDAGSEVVASAVASFLEKANVPLDK